MISNTVTIFDANHQPATPHLPATVDDGPTFRELAARYFKENVEPKYTPASIKNTYSILNAHLFPAFGDTPLRQIQKRHIKKFLNEVGTTRKYYHIHWSGGRKGRANSIYWFMNRFFNWCIDDDNHDGDHLLDINPCWGMTRPFRYYPRERVLSDDEIKYFWWATGLEGYPYGTIARLLLLTAQRRGEIANALKRQIDRKERILYIPISATKSRRSHMVNLSDLALEVLKSVPRIPGRPMLFSRDGKTPLGAMNYCYANRRIQANMIEFRRAEIARDGGDPDEADIPWFVLHDLRRTAATVMCRLGHPLHVVDKCLNHAGGKTGTGRTLNDVAQVYIKHEYLDERREAMQALGAHVAKLGGA
jgi:integrase